MPEQSCTTLAKVDLKDPPYKLVTLAKESGGDVDALINAIDLDYPRLNVSRQQARSLINFAVIEQEKDVLASAPSGTEVMLSKANMILSEELDRLMRQAKLLDIVARKPDGTNWEVEGNGDTMTPDEAFEKLQGVIDRTIKIKNNITTERQSDNASNPMQVNIGVIVGQANDRIRASESTVIDVTT